MNQDQLINLIQTIFKVGGGALASKGFLDNEKWEWISGLAVAIITYLSHKWNATPTPTQPNLPGVSLFLALALSVGLLGSSCSTSAQRTVYETAGTTEVTVDAAMGEWGAYVALNHPPADQEQAVKAAYEKYQASMVVVCDAGAVYAGSGQTNAPSASGALQTAVENASTSISDLEALITTYGVTLH